MTRIRALSVMAGLLLAGISMAHADATLTGNWKMTVGSAAACSLSLAAGTSDTAGTVAAGPGCPSGLATIGQWKTIGSTLELLSPSGDLVAMLKPKGDAYEGKRIEDGRKVALSR